MSGFIDGDLIEDILNLSHAQIKQVLAAEAGGQHIESLEVEDVVALIEELTHLH